MFCGKTASPRESHQKQILLSALDALCFLTSQNRNMGTWGRANCRCRDKQPQSLGYARDDRVWVELVRIEGLQEADPFLRLTQRTYVRWVPESRHVQNETTVGLWSAVNERTPPGSCPVRLLELGAFVVGSG